MKRTFSNVAWALLISCNCWAANPILDDFDTKRDYFQTQLEQISENDPNVDWIVQYRVLGLIYTYSKDQTCDRDLRPKFIDKLRGIIAVGPTIAYIEDHINEYLDVECAKYQYKLWNRSNR